LEAKRSIATPKLQKIVNATTAKRIVARYSFFIVALLLLIIGLSVSWRGILKIIPKIYLLSAITPKRFVKPLSYTGKPLYTKTHIVHISEVL
jgi:hypothetical protein